MGAAANSTAASAAGRSRSTRSRLRPYRGGRERRGLAACERSAASRTRPVVMFIVRGSRSTLASPASRVRGGVRRPSATFAEQPARGGGSLLAGHRPSASGPPVVAAGGREFRRRPRGRRLTASAHPPSLAWVTRGAKLFAFCTQRALAARRSVVWSREPLWTPLPRRRHRRSRGVGAELAVGCGPTDRGPLAVRSFAGAGCARHD